jgi:Ca-activated chloride channel family protein
MNASAPILRRRLFRAASAMLFIIAFPAAALTLRAQNGALRIESFTLQPGGEVQIDNSRGSTRIEAWDSTTVRVVAEKKTPDSRGIESNELVMMGAGNKLIIECRQASQPARIDLTLYVPRQSYLQIVGGAFPVDISGSFLGATVDTTSGAIGYRVPASDDATIDARSGRGNVKSSLALADVEKEGNQSVRGRLGSGESQVLLNSESGTISLTAGPSSSKISRVTPSSSGASSPQRANERDPDQAQPQGQGTDGQDRLGDRAPGSFDRPDQRSNSTSASNGGSIDFAGGDRGVAGDSKSHSGPLERSTQQRSTGGGNMGLRTRIIPSNPSQQSYQERDSTSPTSQGQYDQSQTGPGQSSGSAQSQSAPPDPTVSSGSGSSMVFAGSDIGDDSASKSRGGPFERDRNSRNTGGGNSGLRFRIIPSGEPTYPRVETITFPPSGQAQGYSQPGRAEPQVNSAPSRGSSGQSSNDSDPYQTPRSQPANGYAGSRLPRSNAPSSIDWNDKDSDQPANSRRGGPPVLGRAGYESPSSDAPAPEPTRSSKGSDEEAITLKAALVNLNVSVTNRSGLALGNLKKEDFQIFENGDAQKIEFFAPATAPFNLVLMVDLSGSIKDKLDMIKSAALKFLDVLGPQDKVAVVSFTDEIRVVSQLTADRDELKRRIRGIERPQGGTAFYEAMWFSLVDTLRGTQGQRNAIVVLSDGVDSSMDRYNPMDSRVSFPQLLRRVEESDVIVFPIYFDTEYEEVFERGNSTSEAYATARDQLERIAEGSGGQMFKAEKANDLTGVYKQVAAAIRTVYSIGYQPTNSEKDGTFRRIRVTVDNPDAAVRSRKGYYAK